MKSLDARNRRLKFLFISIIFSLASLFTVPLEAVSRIRQGCFSLRGLGFLCPVIAYAMFALHVHYAKYFVHHMRVSLTFDPTENPEDSLANLESIVKAAHSHFEKLKSDISKHSDTPDTLLLLIKLHFFQKHCINLMQSDDILAEKTEGHYPSYIKLFTINADFIHGTPEKKQEMLACRAALVITKEGKSLSFDDLCKEAESLKTTP